jgi:hypothetical protein
MIRLAFYTENHVIGGAERYLVDLISGLDRDQINMRLCCLAIRTWLLGVIWHSVHKTEHVAQRGLSHVPQMLEPAV